MLKLSCGKPSIAKVLTAPVNDLEPNFFSHIWIKDLGADGISDPYKELPPLFSAEDLQKIDSLISDEDQIRNGGAAMMAYCRTQFTEMSAEEREAIRRALLKYCELDTLAMVMLIEYWLDTVKAK